MSQSWFAVGLFVLFVICLPYLVRRVQAYTGFGMQQEKKSKVLSVVAVGPQQRVVTVQIESGVNQATLVLGVTASSVNCLHKWENTVKHDSTALRTEQGLQ